MKTFIALSFLLAVACAALAQKLDPNATLTQVTIQFTTPRDLDDSDVSADVSLTIGLPPVTVARSTFVLRPGRSNDLALALSQGKKITRKELSDAVLFIRFLPPKGPGRDRWIFDYKVRLGFSDGRWAYDDRMEKVLLDRDRPVESDNIGAGLKGVR
ncbi:MAG: hypothetical protein JO069_07925 [Verrucomicrobia bacterium]|nr:hypothetical protein [Verrucomicrobiota bacterium]